MVKLLLEHGGVKIKSKDKYGDTPLSLATRTGYKMVGLLLLKHVGADIDSKEKYGKPALRFATIQIQELLLKHSATAEEYDPGYSYTQNP